MTSLNFRRYQPADKQAVLALNAQAFEGTAAFLDDPDLDKDLEDIVGNYLNNGGCFFVAETESMIVAMGALRRIDAASAEVKRMRVRRDFQRQGLGQKIFDMLQEHALELGYKNLVLDTTADLVPAQKFYEKNGFSRFKAGYVKGMETFWYRKALRKL